MVSYLDLQSFLGVLARFLMVTTSFDNSMQLSMLQLDLQEASMRFTVFLGSRPWAGKLAGI